MKTVLEHQKPSREEACREVFRAELGSRRQSYAAKLRPITKLGLMMPPSMQKNSKASPELHKQGQGNGQITPFCWASAFLGAAVGVAGPSVFGTFFSNVILWLFISQGRSVQEAYAYIGRYSLSAPMAINLVADVCFALACGWVSVAYGRGARLSQGVVAGLLTVLFPIVMFLNPVGSQMPMPFVALALGVPVFGSAVGAYLFSRKT